MLQNRIYTLNKEGVPKTSSARFLFAVYATSEDFTAEKGVYLRPSIALATPRNVYDVQSEYQRDACNIVKTFCNKRPFAFFWHHGGADDKCQFHGLHIHLVVQCKGRLGQLNQYRVMKKVLAKYGIDVRCQKVQHLEGLLHHLQQEPRVLLACNNLSLCARLQKTCAKNPFYAAVEKPNFCLDEADEVAKAAEDAGNFMMDLLQFKKQAPVPAMT